MRPLYIPSLKDVLELGQDWTFELEEEYRNLTLIKQVDTYYSGDGWPSWSQRTPMPKKWKVTLPAGTKLIVDRIYIRNSKKEFDSISFRTTFNNKKVRFWVHLQHANRIVFV